MSTLKRGFWIVLLAAAFATPIFGQQSGLRELEDRIELLENRVLALEATVQDLLARSPGEAAPVGSRVRAVGEPRVGPVQEPSKDIRGWRNLQLGMNKQDVVSLIGEPHVINKYGDGSETWSYDMGGTVHITPDGRVRSWSEPRRL